MHAVAQLPLRASMPRAAARGTCTTVCELQQARPRRSRRRRSADARAARRPQAGSRPLRSLAGARAPQRLRQGARRVLAGEGRNAGLRVHLPGRLGGAQHAARLASTCFSDTTSGLSRPPLCAVQEVALEGQDKAFKDVIEPLESVSLSILPTTRKSLADAGTPDEVAAALTQKSASATTQVAVVSANQARTPPWRSAKCLLTSPPDCSARMMRATCTISSSSRRRPAGLCATQSPRSRL